MAVCIGAGLTEDGDNVLVATSGTWGDAPLDIFGSSSLVGGPIYCDESGQLRAAPEHDAQIMNVSSSQGLGAVFEASYTATGPKITGTLVNPSPVRAMALMVLITVKFQFEIVTAPASLYVAYNVNGDTGDLAKFHGFPGAHTTEEMIGDSFATYITGGATLTVEVTPRIESGTGSGRFTAMGVGIRALGATTSFVPS